MLPQPNRPRSCCGPIRPWDLPALMLVFLVVWVTDIGGYFAGRGMGGPKLWPRVSPNKTWAGALGGFAASIAVAAGFAAFGLGKTGPLLLLGSFCRLSRSLATCLNRR